jgi:hypothetical protein
MPAQTDKCFKSSGSLKITKRLGNGKYIHLCKNNGHWFKGEVRTAKWKKLGK